VLLIDDPRSFEEIANDCEMAALARRQVLIFAFDPLQLHAAVSDKDFYRLAKRHDIKIHTLSTCYRQKRNVGKAAKKAIDAVAKATPFLDYSKVENFLADHAELTSLSNELEFANPSGYVETYAEADFEDIGDEMERIRQGGGLWKHWPSLLVAIDEELPRTVVAEVKRELGRLARRTLGDSKYVVRSLDDIGSVKGVEYQHVFLVLSQSLYYDIEMGSPGKGKTVYAQRRLLRIPFSRAKDSLVTFALRPDVLRSRS
jgi:hypothetical protein